MRDQAGEASAMNIVDPILYRCRQCPPAAAISTPGSSLSLVSYARLERFIHNIGNRALREGLHDGHVVAVQVEDQMLHALLLLGLMRLGVAVVSAAANRLPASLRVEAVLSDTPFLGIAGVPRVITVGPGWLEGDGRPVDDKHVCRDGDRTASIILTSGSTGSPKATPISHRMITRRIARQVMSIGNQFMECSRFFSDFGLGNGTCLRMLVYILSRGGLFCLPGKDPMDSLQSFELYKIDCLLAAPGGLGAILKFYEENKQFRSGFRVIYTGGSALQKTLSDRVQARLCRELFYSYGTSETATVAVAPARLVADVQGAVGYILPGVSVHIVDADERILPPGAEGRIRIASSSTVTGYLDDPAQTALSFKDGYFYPGDIGVLSDQGLLVISGRVSEVLNLGGEKICPGVVEEALCRFPGVADAAVFTVANSLGTEELWAAIEARSPFNEQAIRAFCERDLALFQRPAHYVLVERLPRNENHKIVRDQLRQFAARQQAG
jgi:acyl-CoA synthetase (AMP-forming)/AMP-acid ligase II